MKLLIDSDFLVGVFRDEDPHHDEAKILLRKYKNQPAQLHVVSLVLFETATVLSHRTGMNAARLFHEHLPELELAVVDVDTNLEKHSWEIFLGQTKKGTSFVDCANLATFELYKLDGILSFDTFYPKEILIKLS